MKKPKMCIQTIRALIGTLNVSLQFMRWQRTMMTCAYVAHTHPHSYNPDTNVDGIIECFIECRDSFMESISVLEDSLTGLEESLHNDCKDVLLLANHVISADNLLLDHFLVSAEAEPALISDELIIKDMLTPSDMSAYRTVRRPLTDIIIQYNLFQSPDTQRATNDPSKMNLNELAQQVHSAFCELLHDLKAYTSDCDAINTSTDNLLAKTCCLSKNELVALTTSLCNRFPETCTELPAPTTSDNMATCLRNLIVLTSRLAHSELPLSKNSEPRLLSILGRLLTIEDTNKTIMLALEPLLDG